jgi:hypothetical protein
MPRIIRRKPWTQRLKEYLNPLDYALYLSEEFESRDWDTPHTANIIGTTLNFIYLLSTANSAGDASEDDVFADAPSGTGWLSWFVRGFSDNSKYADRMLMNLTGTHLCAVSDLSLILPRIPHLHPLTAIPVL